MSDTEQEQEWWESPDTTLDLKFQVRALVVEVKGILAADLSSQQIKDFTDLGWKLYRTIYHPQETDPDPVGKISIEGVDDALMKPLMEGDPPNFSDPGPRGLEKIYRG